MNVDILTREDLKMLMDAGGRCISLFMPSAPGGRQAQNDRIAFKDLLKSAVMLMRMEGMAGTDIEEALAPARRLVRANLFWSHQGRGLAVFIGNDFSRAWRLPLPVETMVSVNERFHVKPLLPLFRPGGKYFVLCISGRHTRFLAGSPYGLSEVDVKAMPRGIQDILKNKVFEQQLRYHAGTSGRMHGGSPVFHGQGTGSDDDWKDELFEYFRKIDDGVRPFLSSEKSPLILAGVNYLLSIYRNAATYRHITEDSINGNPDQSTVEQLHERAQAILLPHYRKAMQDSADRYMHLAGSGSFLAQERVVDVAGAAAQGRVDVLFAAENVQYWGVVEAATGKATVHKKEQPGDSDLMDFACLHTLANGGSVYLAAPENIPGGKHIAAILRY